MKPSYIAGFFDGEGTLNVSKYRFRISIPQTNYQVLEMIKNYFNFGQIYKTKKKKEHHKEAWVYAITNNSDVLKFLLVIKNDLIVKKNIVESNIIALQELEDKKVENNKTREFDKIQVFKLKESGLSYRAMEKIVGFSRQKICRLLNNK